MPTDRVTSIAVVIPCHNEGITIGSVVRDFRAELPSAQILVVDNASNDDTAAVAAAAGARVIYESRKGKGFALVTGFLEMRAADLVVMVDGDNTYPAEDIHKLIDSLGRDADMAIGTRLGSSEEGAFRAGHTYGNRLFTWIVKTLFGVQTSDLLSGYRVITRRFLNVSPLIAQGFEIETDLSLQALAGGFRIVETPVRYRPRPADSTSKLRTVRDGYRILLALVAFFRDYRPLTFFGLCGLGFVALGVIAGLLAGSAAATGKPVALPLATLAVGLGLAGALCFTAGVILSSLMRRSAETAMLLVRNDAR